MIGRLPTNYRMVLNLYIFEQRSHKEIAQMLGIKENTSTSQYFRAKQLLAKMLNDYLNKHKI
jgi:RNA polymerase sigma-70 factor (ECF subfamily)